MPLTNYFDTHLLTLAHLQQSSAAEWIIYVSNLRPRPQGDTNYQGEGPRPYWTVRNPLFLVPESGRARELAAAMYERQEAGQSVNEWPPGVETNSADSDTLPVFSQANPTSDPRLRGVLWFGAQLEAPKDGRWFRLKYADDAEPTHVWISVRPPDRQVILRWEISHHLISRIAGNQPLCDYRAALGLREGLGNDNPVLMTWREEDAGTAIIQVKWTGRLNGVDPPRIFSFSGNTHQLRWIKLEGENVEASNDDYVPAFRRIFSIPVGSTVHTRLGLKERVPPLLPPRELKVESLQVLRGRQWKVRCYYRQDITPDEWDFPSRLVQIWNYLLAQRCYDSLAAIRRGAGTSAAPLLHDAEGNGGDLDLDGRGWFQEYEFTFAQDPDVAWENGLTLTDSGLANELTRPSGTVRADARMVWSAIKSTDGKAVGGANVTLSTRHGLANRAETQGDDGTLFEFFITAHTTVASVRDGALDFEFGGAPEPEAFRDRHYGRLRALLHLRDEQRPLYLFQWEPALAQVPVELSYSVEELVLPLLKVKPGAQDARPEDEFLPPATSGSVVQGAGERTEPPLVIPMAAERPEPSAPVPPAILPARYLWIANESTNVTQSLRLDLRIEALPITTGDAFTASVVVLDSTPQLVAQVHSTFLAVSARDSGTNIVARRSPLSEEREGWEFFDEKAFTEGFSLRLPAQALGEQAVKGDVDFPAGEIADSRFGPPARLRLASERLDRGFVAVYWNLRRILLDRGSASPGVPLLEADFELLYGLAAHLQRSGLLISELASKLGELPTPALARKEWSMTDDQVAAFRKAWLQFLRAYRAWLSRVGVLEVSHESAPLRPVELKDGLNYRARVQVTYDPDTNNPVWDKGAHLAWPRPRGYDVVPQPPPTEPDPVIPQATADLDGYHTEDGLRGGAVWGFEQLEIYREFWRQHREGKHSSSGEIADLAFSSLGGFGRQAARFAHDKTIIRSTVAQGRTHVYAVERIGRIAAFWNKAKHVIEYERVVVPSRQFFGEQPAHVGRPLLRKVREYIEILEPERHYPDFPNQEASGCGTVRTCVFRSRIIPVHSSWGRTVYQKKPPGSQSGTSGAVGQWEAIGWEIPLWQLGLDAEVYPKPQICLHQNPPADSDLEFVSGNIAQPQVLRFYTDTRERDDEGEILTAEVHLWPVIPEVDQTNQPPPAIQNIAPSEGKDGPALDAQLPGAVAVPPGFERFTFSLEPGDLPADVAGAYFKDSGYSGRLRTATMMRGQPTAAVDNNWWGDNQADPPDAAWKARKALSALVRGGDSMAAGAANGFTDLVGKLRTQAIAPAQLRIDDFRHQAESWLSKGRDPLRKLNGFLDRTPPDSNRFVGLWTPLKGTNQPWKLWTRPGCALWSEVLEGADGVVSRALGYYDDLTRDFQAEMDTILAQGEDVLTKGRAAVTRLMDRLKGFSANVEWHFGEAFRLARSILEQSSARAAEALGDFFRNRVLDQLDAIAGQAGGNLDTAKAAVLQALATARDEALAQLQRLRTSLPADQAGIPGPTLAELLDAIRDLINGLHDRLAQQVNGVTTPTTVEELMQQVETGLRTEIETLQSEAEDGLNEIKARVTKLLGAVEQHARELHSDVQAALAAAIYDLDQIRTLIADTKKTLAEVQQGIKEVIAEVRVDVETTLVAEIRMLLVGGWVPADPPVSPNLTTVYGGVLFLDQVFRDIGKYFDSLLEDLAGGAIGEAAKRLFDALQSAADLEKAIRSGDPEAIIKAATALAEDINAEIGKAAGQVADIAREAMKIAQLGDIAVQELNNVLRNARTVWDEFTAPGLGFNRRTIEMVVNFNPKNIEERLGITPCIARVKEFGESLEGLGLRFPAVGLADRLLPAIKDRFQELSEALLNKFDFSNLLSDIGGMRLTKLLPMLKMPEWAEDKVKITKGFDKEKLKAWVHAETDIQFSDRKTLMHFGPLLVTLNQGHFIGMVHLEADADGKVDKVSRGSLSGDWTITIGGQEFMTYHGVVIRFEGGKLDFDLDPKRMTCPGLLRLMTDVSQTIPFENGCFKIGLVNDGGLPVGVRADLELGPFGGSGGVSGISNLLFGGYFELRVFELPNKFVFTVATGFHVGKQEAPFDLQVFILGGGGYLDLAFTYQPLKNALGVDVQLAVHASASLRVDVGWLRGGVAIYLGLEAEYHKKPAQSAAFSAALFIMVEGYVSIISLITIHLMLRLACTFKSLGGGGTELSGSGMVSVTIRITRFFKISVRKAYTRVIARSGGGGQRKLREAADRAELLAVRVVDAAQPALRDAQRAARRNFIAAIEDTEVRDALETIHERCARHIGMLRP